MIVGKATINGQRVSVYKNPMNHWVFDGCFECGGAIGPFKMYTFEEQGRSKHAYCVKCHPLDNMAYKKKLMND